MPHEPTVIYSAANTQQAYLLKGILEDRGIQARVVNEAIQIAGGDLPIGWTAAAKVVVSSESALKARQIAEEFDVQTAHEPTPDDINTSAADTAEWTDWPVCPQCGQRRSARCPFCGASGVDFPLADIQDNAGGQRVLLYCGSCDDHFLPDWARLCAACGHDYGSGFDAAPPATSIEWNPRAILVAAAILVGVLALGAYFYLLFAQRAA